jgi:nucleotide-binding universal stress UspA family protein
MTFTHVLVPTDCSAPAEQALRYARAEAAVHHATRTRSYAWRTSVELIASSWAGMVVLASYMCSTAASPHRWSGWRRVQC